MGALYPTLPTSPWQALYTLPWSWRSHCPQGSGPRLEGVIWLPPRWPLPTPNSPGPSSWKLEANGQATFFRTWKGHSG